MLLFTSTRFIRAAVAALNALAIIGSTALGQTAYVSMNGTGTIKTVLSSFTLGASPYATGLLAPKGVAFDSSGNLYVVEDISGTLTSVITKIAPNGTKTTYATGLQRSIDLAFDASGNLFISDYNSANSIFNAIMKVAPGGGVATTFVSGSQLNSPFGLAFNSSGVLFVSNRDDGSISQIATNGSVTSFLSAGTFSQPNDLTFDSSGNLYVANFSSGAIAKVTGSSVNLSFSNVANAVGLAFDPVSGNLFVASQGGSSLYEISSSGGASTQFAFFGGDSPQYLAFAPGAVPEPSTYAAIAGVAVLGLALWRRRRQSAAV